MIEYGRVIINPGRYDLMLDNIISVFFNFSADNNIINFFKQWII